MFEGFKQVRVDTGEVAINAVVGGQGQPLLLLHGYPQTHVIWHKIAPRLAARFTVVAADLRGYGDSDRLDRIAILPRESLFVSRVFAWQPRARPSRDRLS